MIKTTSAYFGIICWPKVLVTGPVRRLVGVRIIDKLWRKRHFLRNTPRSIQFQTSNTEYLVFKPLAYYAIPFHSCSRAWTPSKSNCVTCGTVSLFTFANRTALICLYLNCMIYWITNRLGEVDMKKMKSSKRVCKLSNFINSLILQPWVAYGEAGGGRQRGIFNGWGGENRTLCVRRQQCVRKKVTNRIY